MGPGRVGGRCPDFPLSGSGAIRKSDRAEPGIIFMRFGLVVCQNE